MPLNTTFEQLSQENRHVLVVGLAGELKRETAEQFKSGDSGEVEQHSGGKPNTIPVIANTIGAKRRWQSDCA